MVQPAPPYAKVAWSVSQIPGGQKISEQIDLDQGVMNMLDVVDQAPGLVQDAETLRLRCQRSDNHKKCLIDLITECGYFIQSHLKDVNFTTEKMVVENHRKTFQKLHDFVNEAIVNAELNIRSRSEIAGIIRNRYKIQPRERLQTRVKSLDAITDWVNDLDPQSPRVLVLVGQAGTGKSSIAHEVAHGFHRVHRLTTSYCFVRGQPLSQEYYRFFTTLTCDLCNKHPPFRTLFGKIISGNRDLVPARDFTTLFEMLLRNPLHGACLTQVLSLLS